MKKQKQKKQPKKKKKKKQQQPKLIHEHKFDFSCSDKRHDQKQHGEEKVYLANTFQSQSIMEGSQGRHLEAGNE